MFNLNRQSPFDELFDFQRDRRPHVQPVLERSADPHGVLVGGLVPGEHHAGRLADQVPLPGIDPEHVNLEVAGNTLSIRAEVPGEERALPVERYEQR